MNKDDANAIRQAAYAWHLRLSERDAKAHVQIDFRNWLIEDPRHQDAFERAAVILNATGGLTRSDIDSELLPTFARRPGNLETGFWPTLLRRRLIFLIPTAVTLLIAISAIAIPNLVSTPVSITPVNIETDNYTTQFAQHQTVSLSDGSTVQLGPASEIKVTMSSKARYVELLRGAAYFDVASDPSRPFSVNSQLLTATALGTQFDVRQTPLFTRVAVAEGAVQVAHPLIFNNQPTKLSVRETLRPGEQISAIPSIGMEVVTKIDIEAIAAWRSDRLIYQSASLSELLSDADRYTDKTVSIAAGSEHIADLKISGAFNGQDIERMLATLELIHPVRVDSSDPEAILLRAD